MDSTKSSISLWTLLKKENSVKSGWKHRGSSDTCRSLSDLRRSEYTARVGGWVCSRRSWGADAAAALGAAKAAAGRRLNVAPARSSVFLPP